MAFFISFLLFSLTFSLLCPYSASQPTQPSANEARSGGGPESDQTYVVAPTLRDCPNDTRCETLSYYAGKYTNKLSNVVFWFLPGMHNLSQTWEMKNSRNVVLLGGNNMTNSGKSSGGTSKILCQKGLSYGIYVSKSNVIVVENITIAHCAFAALTFDTAVNATVKNVTITHNVISLQVGLCQRFTLTKSELDYCFFGVFLLGSSSTEISNSKISNCSLANIACVLNGGNITINHFGWEFLWNFVHAKFCESVVARRKIKCEYFQQQNNSEEKEKQCNLCLLE